MEIKAHQDRLKGAHSFKNAAEIMLAATEELGEVAQEVALLEKIGTKAQWSKEGDKERLAKEITQVLNCIVALANHYDIDLEESYKERKVQ